MAAPTDLPVLTFADAAAFEAWVAEHADDEGAGVWLRIAKKATGIPTVTYAEALDVALCHGWIDGQKRGFDEQWFLQRFTPRRARSLWSKRNREHVERLVAAGRMGARGQREVDRAKDDGRWAAAYDAQGSAEVPEDFRAALDANPPAAAFFAGLTGTRRYAFLFRVQTAKRPETRARRIASFVALLAEGRTLE